LRASLTFTFINWGGGRRGEKRKEKEKRKEGKKAAKLLNNKGITFFWNINYFSLFH
jgi:hypothetical protein